MTVSMVITMILLLCALKPSHDTLRMVRENHERSMQEQIDTTWEPPPVSSDQLEILGNLGFIWAGQYPNPTGRWIQKFESEEEYEAHFIDGRFDGINDADISVFCTHPYDNIEATLTALELVLGQIEEYEPRERISMDDGAVCVVYDPPLRTGSD